MLNDLWNLRTWPFKCSTPQASILNSFFFFLCHVIYPVALIFWLGFNGYLKVWLLSVHYFLRPLLSETSDSYVQRPLESLHAPFAWILHPPVSTFEFPVCSISDSSRLRKCFWESGVTLPAQPSSSLITSRLHSPRVFLSALSSALPSIAAGEVYLNPENLSFLFHQTFNGSQFSVESRPGAPAGPSWIWHIFPSRKLQLPSTVDSVLFACYTNFLRSLCIQKSLILLPRRFCLFSLSPIPFYMIPLHSLRTSKYHCHQKSFPDPVNNL